MRSRMMRRMRRRMMRRRMRRSSLRNTYRSATAETSLYKHPYIYEAPGYMLTSWFSSVREVPVYNPHWPQGSSNAPIYKLHQPQDISSARIHVHHPPLAAKRLVDIYFHGCGVSTWILQKVLKKPLLFAAGLHLCKRSRAKCFLKSISFTSLKQTRSQSTYRESNLRP